MLSFWWVRHAPVINNNDCCYGDNEVECDVTDKSTFKALVNILPKKALVYSSTLSRAVKTFSAAKQEGFEYISYSKDARLKEQNIGKWAGMKYLDLYKLTKKLGINSCHWLMKEEHIPPEGESFLKVNNRISCFLNEKILKYQDTDIVIFSHGGPIRSALNIALGNETVSVGTFKIDNLKVTKISYHEEKWQIDFVNY